VGKFGLSQKKEKKLRFSSHFHCRLCKVFPIVPHGYIVDDHVIYAAALIFIAVFTPAQHFGLGKMLRGTFLGRLPVIGPML
jgi:hypothetical protein